MWGFCQHQESIWHSWSWDLDIKAVALWNKRNSECLGQILSHKQDALHFNWWNFVCPLKVLCFWLNSIRFSSPFHFAGNTGLLKFKTVYLSSKKALNKYFRELSFWLNANKISKPEIILFKTGNKNHYSNLKINPAKKRIHASPYVKYLGVFINEQVNWKTHINEIWTKVIKGNAMLSKLQHFINKDILLLVYYAIFHSHLPFLCFDWRQAKFPLNRITLLQKRDIGILESVAYGDHTCPLFCRYKVLKFIDLV